MLKIPDKIISLEDIKNYFEKTNYHWGLFAVICGLIIGLVFLMICIIFDLTIFGITLAGFISPLLSGYVETFIAKRWYGETTGAISAMLLFFITVAYGFIYPANPINLNIFLIGGIAVILQAAFPILINYILYILIVGIIFYLMGKIGEILYDIGEFSRMIYSLIMNKPYYPKKEKKHKEIDINNLGVLFLSSTHSNLNQKKEYLGIFEEIQYVKIPKVTFFESSEKKDENILNYLIKLKKDAFLSLANKAKDSGVDILLDIEIDYNTIDLMQEESLQIVIRGTGVKIIE